jgi:hypothetical protein
MITSINVETPLINNTMSSRLCKNYKEGGGRTWVYSHEI